MVKNPPAKAGAAEDAVSIPGSLGREDPLEEEMTTHCSILAWKIPWTEEAGGYSPQGLKEPERTACMHTHTHTHRGREADPAKPQCKCRERLHNSNEPSAM